MQLVLAGSMATDDPEGFHYWELADEARAGDPDIHLLSNIQQVGDVQINAFQRAADVVMQKSLREGFGLTVSEGAVEGPARWSAAGAAASRCRSKTARTATSSTTSRTRPQRTADLLAQPDPGRRDGRGRPRATCARTSCRRASSKTGCGSSEISE